MSDNPNTSTAVGASVNPTENKFTDWLSHVLADLGKNGIFIALIAVIALFTVLTNGILLRPQNISNLVVQNGYILVLAIGMVMVIIAGHIDLSVGSVAAFIGAISGVLAVKMEYPWWLAVVISLAIAALVGAWQGFWVAFVGIPAFIVTLAGMLIFRGLALVVLGNANIGSFPTEYRALGNGFISGVFGETSPDLFTLAIGAVAIVALVIQQTAHPSRTQEVRPGGRAADVVHRQAGRGRRRDRSVRLGSGVLQGHPGHPHHFGRCWSWCTAS